MHALPPRVALVPNAIAFRDPAHGILGTGWTACADRSFRCRPQGTISLTTDGGRTWKVLLRTPRPVTFATWTQGRMTARYDDGENVSSADGGRHWAPLATGPPFFSNCPQGWAQQASNPPYLSWALCTTQGGAGSMGKAVYRQKERWTRVAYTPFGPGRGYGGIDVFGYPQGITMANDGFGIIWESRGTLYVTRDYGSSWVGLAKVVRPDVDFGASAYALRHGIGFVILGGSEKRRLLETTDAGRSWRVVHIWS
jgi:photosystem II stability/assembly factor-like uncharacterized protein